MKTIDKILEILQEFLSKITAKRLAAFALYLFYMAFLFWKMAGHKVANTTDVVKLEALAFMGLPTICFLVLVFALTWKGGGDEMVSIPKKAVDTKKSKK